MCLCSLAGAALGPDVVPTVSGASVQVSMFFKKHAQSLTQHANPTTDPIFVPSWSLSRAIQQTSEKKTTHTWRQSSDYATCNSLPCRRTSKAASFQSAQQKWCFACCTRTKSRTHLCTRRSCTRSSASSMGHDQSPLPTCVLGLRRFVPRTVPIIRLCSTVLC